MSILRLRVSIRYHTIHTPRICTGLNWGRDAKKLSTSPKRSCWCGVDAAAAQKARLSGQEHAACASNLLLVSLWVEGGVEKSENRKNG